MPQTIAPIDPFQRITGIRLSLGGWYLRTVTAIASTLPQFQAWDFVNDLALMSGQNAGNDMYMYDGTTVTGPVDTVDNAFTSGGAWIGSADQFLAVQGRTVFQWDSPSGPWDPGGIHTSANVNDVFFPGDRNSAGDEGVFILNNFVSGDYEIVTFASGGAKTFVATGPNSGDTIRNVRCLFTSGDLVVEQTSVSPHHLWRYDGSWTDDGAAPFTGNWETVASSGAYFAMDLTTLPGALYAAYGAGDTALTLIDDGATRPAYAGATRNMIFAEPFNEIWTNAFTGSVLEIWALPVPAEYL